MSYVTMQAWLFLSSYDKLRFMIANKKINSLIKIGFNSFPELNSQVAHATAFVIQNIKMGLFRGKYFDFNTNKTNDDKERVYLERKKIVIILRFQVSSFLNIQIIILLFGYQTRRQKY